MKPRGDSWVFAMKALVGGHFSFFRVQFWGKYHNKLQDKAMTDKFDFLYPRSRYYGSVKPENLVFNANLQEFAQRVTYISCLETQGKLAPEEAYEKIKALWKQLKRTRKQLGIGQDSFESGKGNTQS